MDPQIEATLDAIYERRPFSWLPKDRLANWIKWMVRLLED
jgi:hypothetical protein